MVFSWRKLCMFIDHYAYANSVFLFYLLYYLGWITFNANWALGPVQCFVSKERLVLKLYFPCPLFIRSKGTVSKSTNSCEDWYSTDSPRLNDQSLGDQSYDRPPESYLQPIFEILKPSHTHVIEFWSFGNQPTFTTVAVSHIHVTRIYIFFARNWHLLLVSNKKMAIEDDGIA